MRQIATFLGKTLDQAQLQKIVDHCSFKNMKTNPTTNYSWLQDLGFAKKNGEAVFFRKGAYCLCLTKRNVPVYFSLKIRNRVVIYYSTFSGRVGFRCIDLGL